MYCPYKTSGKKMGGGFCLWFMLHKSHRLGSILSKAIRILRLVVVMVSQTLVFYMSSDTRDSLLFTLFLHISNSAADDLLK